MTEGWGWFIGKIVAKTGAKIALNVYTCGLGAIVEFADAANDFSNGDTFGGFISIVSGIGDVVTAGLMSNIMGAMTQSSKTAVVETAINGAKPVAKEATKKVGKELAKDLAKETVTSAEKEVAIKLARETARIARKDATKKFGQKVGEVLAKGVISETVEEVLSGSGITLAQNILLEVAAYGGKQHEKALVGALISEGLPQFYSEILKSKNKEAAYAFTEKAAKTAAQTEFNKHAHKLVFKDCGVAAAKFGINVTEKGLQIAENDNTAFQPIVTEYSFKF